MVIMSIRLIARLIIVLEISIYISRRLLVLTAQGCHLDYFPCKYTRAPEVTFILFIM